MPRCLRPASGYRGAEFAVSRLRAGQLHRM